MLALIPVLLGGCALDELAPQLGEGSVLNNLFAGPQENVAELAQDPYDPDARYRGTVRLANQLVEPDELVVDIFRENLDDEYASVRAAAARGIAAHGRAADAALLIDALYDEDPLVRRAAAMGLQRMHDPDAVPRLIELIDPEIEPEETIRVEAALALGQYPQSEVVLALIESLRSDLEQSLTVHRSAAGSLATLTGQDYGLDFERWQRWSDSESDWFAGQEEYIYPVFSRSRAWYEYIVPVLPPPPNETPSTPIGLSRAPR
ncbi:MAG: HEAT repeat domain-containing protein [Planctomycetota bacterium]